MSSIVLQGVSLRIHEWYHPKNQASIRKLSARYALVMNAAHDISGAWLESLCGPFYLHELTVIPVWMDNYIHYKVWDGITYHFPNVNGAALNVLWMGKHLYTTILLGMWLRIHAEFNANQC